jgi:hypothetical protein
MLRLYEWTKRKLIWNGVFSFITSQFPPIIIACMINLYGVRAFNS